MFGILFGILALGISSGQMVFADPGEAIGSEARSGDSVNNDLASTRSLELLEPEQIGVTFFGNGGYSADGSGTAENLLKVETPAGSTIEQAYLYFSLPSFPTFCGPTVNVTFDGQSKTLDKLPTGNINDYGCAYRTEVTSQVAAKVGASGGITNFPVSGFGSNGIWRNYKFSGLRFWI
jgi:hypothetical protein